MSRLRRVYKIHHATVLKRMRTRAYHEQGGLCFYCGLPFELEEITADHVKPKYAGGMTLPGNIVAACAPCNNSRNSDETNRRGKGFTCIAGDDTPRSPFEGLAALKRDDEAKT